MIVSEVSSIILYDCLHDSVVLPFNLYVWVQDSVVSLINVYECLQVFSVFFNQVV